MTANKIMWTSELEEEFFQDVHALQRNDWFGLLSVCSKWNLSQEEIVAKLHEMALYHLNVCYYRLTGTVYRSKVTGGNRPVEQTFQQTFQLSP